MNTQYDSMKYEWTNNASSTLTIVFQSAGRISPRNLQRILDGTISEPEVARLHDQLNWRKLASAFPGSDYLFVKDHYSKSYGWYVLDAGTWIHQDINADLEKFIIDRKYQKIVAFGSSKGGTAALLFGMKNPFITDVLALVPQIEIATYWKQHLPNHMHLLFGNKNPAQTEIALNCLMYNPNIRQSIGATNFWTYTGIKDDQFEQISRFHWSMNDSSSHALIVNTAHQGHTPLVTENTEFLYNVFHSVIESKEPSDDRLFKLGGGIQLYV